MEFKITTEPEHFTRERPFITLKLDTLEAKELYDILMTDKFNRVLKNNILQPLKTFLTSYDTGKWDKLTEFKGGK